MTRDQYKQHKSLIKHWANGMKIQFKPYDTHDDWVETDDILDFVNYEYRIAPTSIHTPLTQQDFLKGGPWWLRLDKNNDRVYLVSEVLQTGVIFSEDSYLDFDELITHDRMSASNPNASWEPCFKEK